LDRIGSVRGAKAKLWLTNVSCFKALDSYTYKYITKSVKIKFAGVFACIALDDA